MTETACWQPKQQTARTRAACEAAPAAGGYFYSGEYAYFWAYFFVASHADRRAVT